MLKAVGCSSRSPLTGKEPFGERRGLPIECVGSPFFALAIQRIAVEIPTPNRAAACRANMAAEDAVSTRLRRPSLSDCGIIGPLRFECRGSALAVTLDFIDQGICSNKQMTPDCANNPCACLSSLICYSSCAFSKYHRPHLRSNCCSKLCCSKM